MTADGEFRAAAKLSAHDRVQKAGGPRGMSMGEMINIGVDTGVDHERMRTQSVLRSKGFVQLAQELSEEWA